MACSANFVNFKIRPLFPFNHLYAFKVTKALADTYNVALAVTDAFKRRGANMLNSNKNCQGKCKCAEKQAPAGKKFISIVVDDWLKEVIDDE